MTSVSSLDSASRGEFAWIVVSEPSWPVFIAWSMSSVSAPRTSPTMIRSGRMRNALRTSSRIIVGERSEEHTSELQSQSNLVCRLLLEKKKKKKKNKYTKTTNNK